jgi:hypothetical protein
MEMMELFKSDFLPSRNAGVHMTHQRKIYQSSNGDSWWLCRDGGQDGQVFILHEANTAAGGRATRIGIGEFLRTGNAGPEHQSLLRLIGELAQLSAAP